MIRKPPVFLLAVSTVSLLIFGCKTTRSARGHSKVDAESDPISVADVPIVAEVQNPDSDRPVSEVQCGFNLNFTVSNSLSKTVICRDKLRRQASQAGGDYVLLTTQQTICLQGSCRVIFVGSAYRRGPKSEGETEAE